MKLTNRKKDSAGKVSHPDVDLHSASLLRFIMIFTDGN